MRKSTIIVDLDNTLVDTAIRKLSLLKDFLPAPQISEDKVREDYDLITVLGPRETEANRGFMDILDSEKGILEHPAPLFSGSREVLDSFTKSGINIVLLTGRPEKLRGATLKEIEEINISQYVSALYMYQPGTESVAKFKERKIDEMLRCFDVIASIGDQQDDYLAALKSNIPFIQFGVNLHRSDTPSVFSGGSVCLSWDDIKQTIETIIEGREKLHSLRQDFTDSYSKWLTDLDNKARNVAAISGLLATFTGKLVLDVKHIFIWTDWLLVSSLALSVLAFFYCLRSMTSRKTSGPQASAVITTSLKQWFSILFGFPKKWRYVEGDPVSFYSEMLDSKPEEQARAHLDFFYDQFKTYDPDAIANLRLLQLRAVNYSKAYAEIIASKLLTVSVLLFLVWLPIYCLRP